MPRLGNKRANCGAGIARYDTTDLRKANAVENSFWSPTWLRQFGPVLTFGRHEQQQSSAPSSLADIPPMLRVRSSEIQSDLKRFYSGRGMRKKTCPVALLLRQPWALYYLYFKPGNLTTEKSKFVSLFATRSRWFHHNDIPGGEFKN